jgi:hypothetical protein
MKGGTILLIRDSNDPSELSLAEKARSYLEDKGVLNIRIASHKGFPPIAEVMDSMFEEGTDSFAIIPMLISEGRLSTWIMPKEAGIPDNCGSWRMMGGQDVAMRFSTTPGVDRDLMDSVADSLGEPEKGTGILLIHYGSGLSMAAKNIGMYADRISKRGWPVSYAALSKGSEELERAVRELSEKGVSKVRVLPAFIHFDEDRYRWALDRVGRSFGAVEVLEPVSSREEFLRAIERRVPDEWRRRALDDFHPLFPIRYL